MSVLTIRAHRRYATRLPVTLNRNTGRNAGRGCGACGLLIELSQHGARISNLGACDYAVGDAVELCMEGGDPLPGTVRWAHDGLAGIRLDRPLHLPELRGLLELNAARDAEPELRFGT